MKGVGVVGVAMSKYPVYDSWARYKKNVKSLDAYDKLKEFYRQAFGGPSSSEEIKRKNLEWDRKWLGR